MIKFSHGPDQVLSQLETSALQQPAYAAAGDRYRPLRWLASKTSPADR
jgi:hypothetical protein